MAHPTPNPFWGGKIPAFDPLALLQLLTAGVVILLTAATSNVYVFRRKKSFVFPEKYLFETTLKAGYWRYDDFLHFIWESFQYAEIEYKSKTFAVHCLFLPTFVFTNSVENVTHILKGNFDNYVKGPAMKFRFLPLLGDGIFNADGEIWRWHRKTSAHLFNVAAFRSTVLATFNKHVSHVIQILLQQSDLDLHALMHSCTLDSIGEIAFGMQINSLSSHIENPSGATTPGLEFEKSFDYLQQFAAETYTNPMWPFKRFFTWHLWRYPMHVRTVDNYAYSAVRARRAEMRERGPEAFSSGPGKRTDLLSLYFSHKIGDDFGDNNDENGTDGEEKVKKSSPAELSDKMLRDILLNFVIAGRDTTAQALSWSLFELSRNPEIQNRARAEVLQEWKTMTVTPSDSAAEVSFESLGRMRYLDAVCHETLRLYPSVPKEAKYAQQDDVLPDGFKVHKGDSVCFFPWVMGRTVALWGEDCLVFRPERFLDTPKPSPFIFTAFQAGPRTCLGQNLALLEMKCVLARLLAVFSFQIPKQNATATAVQTPRYGYSLTLPMAAPLKLTVTPLVSNNL